MPGYSQDPFGVRITSECPKFLASAFNRTVLARLLAVCFVLCRLIGPAVAANASPEALLQFLDGSVLHGKLSEIQQTRE